MILKNKKGQSLDSPYTDEQAVEILKGGETDFHTSLRNAFGSLAGWSDEQRFWAHFNAMKIASPKVRMTTLSSTRMVAVSPPVIVDPPLPETPAAVQDTAIYFRFGSVHDLLSQAPDDTDSSMTFRFDDTELMVSRGECCVHLSRRTGGRWKKIGIHDVCQSPNMRVWGELSDDERKFLEVLSMDPLDVAKHVGRVSGVCVFTDRKLADAAHIAGISKVAAATYGDASRRPPRCAKPDRNEQNDPMKSMIRKNEDFLRACDEKNAAEDAVEEEFVF